MSHESELQLLIERRRYRELQARFAATSEAVTESLDVLMRENVQLREALRGLVSAVSARLTRGEDEEPGQFDAAWKTACAALAGEVTT